MMSDKEERELSTLMDLLISSLEDGDYELASEWAMYISDLCHELSNLQQEDEE